METNNNTSLPPEELGGTTNLSLDQLKKEGGIANPTEGNANGLDNPDDVHEIQAGDDLDEPDTEDLVADDDDEVTDATADQ